MEFFGVFLIQLILLPPLITSSFLPDDCPAMCGDITIEYPFGIGTGCFKLGFELSCDHSTNPPKLFIVDETTIQVTGLDYSYGFMYATTGITIMPPDVKDFNVTWTAPSNGTYFLPSDCNSLTIIGCGIIANLMVKNVSIGQCAALCSSEEALMAANGSSCTNTGCCEIEIPPIIETYMLQITRIEEFNQLYLDYEVKVFLSSDMYTFMPDNLYSGSKFDSTTRVDIVLGWNIPHPPTCEAAKAQNDSYACLAKDSYCINKTSFGYSCRCPSDSIDVTGGNPYIPGGCGDHNSIQPNSTCQKKCGNNDILFPFGLGQGCYRNPNFALMCNGSAEQGTLQFSDASNFMDLYQVDKILIEEAQIQVHAIDRTNQPGYIKPFFFYNASGLFNWVIGYTSCDQAKRSMATYACVSDHSSCVNMNLTGSQVGYYCNCKQGYEGNPYLAHGCKDINECLYREKYCPSGSCQNFDGGYLCCHSGTYLDRINKLCVTQHQTRNMAVGFYIGLGFGIGFISLLIILGIIFCKRVLHKRIQKKLRQKYFHQNHGLLLQQLISCNGDIAEKTEIFTFEELEKATSNFDQSRIVGRGGHGTVFKGLLSDQRVVAIKKSKLIIKREIDQFINEVVILSRINHRNIVKLFGCCLETEVPLLVYEFISSGTLHNHLHSTDLKSTLSWEDRLQIASQTAGALSYLHSSASISIFHRDVKSANILLDEYSTAKVSDFGASRLIPIDQTQVATVVQGTYGYLDPEYHHTGQLTEKSDVYSFGVILAELLTGEMPISFSRVEEERNLSAHFLRAIKDNSISEIVEARVKDESTMDELEEFIHLAEVCLSLSGEKRPTMREVEYKLQSLRMIRKQKNESNQMPHIRERESLSSSNGQSSVEAIGIPWDNPRINTSDQTVSLLTCPR